MSIKNSDELDRFKSEINLFEVVQDYGFSEIKKTSLPSRTFRNGEKGAGDKITVSLKKSIYVYKNWHDDQDKGTVIDFVQRRESELNFGQLRVLLRKYIPGATRPAGTNHQSKTKSAPHCSEPTKESVKLTREEIADGWALLPLYEGSYLRSRGLTDEIVQRFDVRQDERGNACFAHTDEDGLTGWEKKNLEWTAFHTGSIKALMIQAIDSGPVKRVVICEAAIDAMSYAQLKHEQGDLYVSTSGTISAKQIEGLYQLFELYPSAEFVCAQDADRGGQIATDGIFLMAKGKVKATRERPPVVGLEEKDWNEILKRTLGIGQSKILRSTVSYPKFGDKRCA